MRRIPILAVAALAAALTACDEPSDSRDAGASASDAAPVKPDAAAVPEDAGTGGEDAGVPDTGQQPGPDAGPSLCLPAAGTGTDPTSELVDGADKATVTVFNRDGCTRTYSLATTAALRDSEPANPRTVAELPGQPTLRTRNDLFDALYALAVEEARQDSVASIKNDAFDGGRPMDCPAGGCFETGRLWTYVWTRDTAFAVALGLGAFDPTRARNSLEFKLSERRGGGDLQIVQDTGTGGSYPVSTDRVAWAMGAWEVLKYLDGAERTAFRDRAYEAIKNTLEHDRVVVFDPVDGLYRGEQSFLDWREQTYPGWTATDPVQIAMSKALSTNALHLFALDVAASLAEEKGDAAASGRYRGWANALRDAIRAKFWLADQKLFSTYLTTYLDPSPAARFDLLGSAFAALDVADGQMARDVVARYPHAGKGPPVAWPQQQETAIYHNRAIWPFVTAFWLQAARQVRNDAAVNFSVASMIRGAALNLSNMENFELVTGKAYLSEGPTSGPVVNSHRQLWSVAGYLSMVQDGLFGLDASQTGLRFAPYVTRELRHTLFANADSIVLNGFRYRGHSITVVVALPPKGASRAGAYAVGQVKLDGAPVSASQLIEAASLKEASRIDVELLDTPEAGSTITLVSDTANYRNLFGPRTPAVSATMEDAGKILLTLSRSNEAASEVAFNVYRDGVQVASGLPGTTETWLDPDSGDMHDKTHCYAVETYFVASGTTSQHSAPRCHWCPTCIQSVYAPAFSHTGGDLIDNHGRKHIQNWGDTGHLIEVGGFKPNHTGRYLLQLEAGNGAGPISTGVTCGVKRVAVEELPSGTVVAEGQLLMPQLGDWALWRGSSFLPVRLDASKTYRVKVGDDRHSMNMSSLQHFARYTGGLGGSSGEFHRVNVSEVKFLALDGF